MSDSLSTLQHRMKMADDLRSVVTTMKAVAAASIARLEQAAASLEGYDRAVELSLAVHYRHHPPSAECGGGESGQAGSPPTPALLVFGTDQGMVGPFNESLVTQVTARLDSDPRPTALWVVGERIQYRLENAGYPVARVFATPGSVEAVTGLICEVLQEIEHAWSTGQVAAVWHVHNAPISRAHYEVRWNDLLPLDLAFEQRLWRIPWPTAQLPELIHDGAETLPAFLSEFLFVSLSRACIESLTAENGARLSAMQRAERNIDDRLSEFRRAFNRRRQAAIDEELSDLVAGFESLRSERGEDDR